jgi:hypothetical protein
VEGLADFAERVRKLKGGADAMVTTAGRHPYLPMYFTNPRGR